MGRIQIVYICDNDYIIPTKTSINSLIKNRCRSLYNITILGVNLQDVNIMEFEKMSSYFVKIRVLNVDDKEITSIGQKGFYVSPNSLLKFKISEILLNYKKVLYLDGDTIVLGDLKELWNVKLKDKFCAGVIDFPTELRKNGSNIINTDTYFNSGVMLLNLELLRNEGVFFKLINAKKNDTLMRFMDQDAFNVVFNKKVRLLPLKYNCIINELENFSLTEISNLFGYDVHNDVDAPLIIHYAGIAKPWKEILTNNIEKWIKYLCDEADIEMCIRRYRKSIEDKVESIRVKSIYQE